ncbi:MAG: ankyrin repeat domain-containing protein [Zoogloeaceae bacterium]|nr:ankyrin repeat domain-containing protein [Rhodocyclaceae bacterium]MCP5234245.1 ankyrin repeat domain-containing protein [Zoogloeaceae bacterium]
MHKSALIKRRPVRLLALATVIVLPAVAVAAGPSEADSPWSAVYQAAQASCPRNAQLPRTLVDAAACGDLARVRDRVEAGADLGAVDARPAYAGRTALHYAAQRGDEPMLALLLDAGADPNAKDARGDTALHLLANQTASGKSLAMMRQLLAYGADAQLTNEFGRTALGEMATAARSVSPIRANREPLEQLLAQAEATGPVTTAEPRPPRSAPTDVRPIDADAGRDATDLAPAALGPTPSTPTTVSAATAGADTTADQAPSTHQVPPANVEAEPSSTPAPEAPPATTDTGPKWSAEPAQAAVDQGAEGTAAAAPQAPVAADAGNSVSPAGPALTWQPTPGPAVGETADAATDPARPAAAESSPEAGATAGDDAGPAPEAATDSTAGASIPAGPVTAATDAAQAVAAEAPATGAPTGEPAMAEQPAPATAEQAVRTALARWATDWSSGDVEAYLAHYAGDFAPADGNTIEAWREQSRARVARPDAIRVGLSEISVEVEGDHAVARFVQDYQSASHKVVNRKRLDLVREGERWRIVGEHVEH